MKCLLLHTLIMLGVVLHTGSCTDDVELVVRVGENTTIRCTIPNPEQNGVYMYFKCDNSTTKVDVMYYYEDGTLTPQKPYIGRLNTSQSFEDFTVFLSNVSERDSGVYWCEFNKGRDTTLSLQTRLKVLSESITEMLQTTGDYTTTDYTQKSQMRNVEWIYIGVIIMLLVIILFLIIAVVKLYCDHGNYNPTQQPSLNGVYEVMRGNTGNSLINQTYKSSRRAHNALH